MWQLRQLIPQEICLKCDVCCRFSQKPSQWAPVLSRDEVDLLKDEKSAKVKLLDNHQFELTPSKSGFICPGFSIKDNRCQIYNTRPHQCQLYPFVLSKNNGRIILAMDLKCPFIYKGVEAGTVKKDLGFSRYIQYLINLFNSRRGIEFITNNLQLIGNYTQDIIVLATLERLSDTLAKRYETRVSSPQTRR